MVVFFVWLIGLIGTLFLSVAGLTYIVVTLAERRPSELRLPAAVLGGYVGGALFVWSLVPRDWTMPLWTTFAAAVNAEKYGHEVEHSAEGIAIWILFGAVLGAVGAGLASVWHPAGSSRS